MSHGGVKGNIKVAVNNLSSFTLDSEDAILQMKVDLTQTQDKLRDLEKKQQLQESRLRDMKQAKAAAAAEGSEQAARVSAAA